jgi:hypothetical protein
MTGGSMVLTRGTAPAAKNLFKIRPFTATINVRCEFRVSRPVFLAVFT